MKNLFVIITGIVALKALSMDEADDWENEKFYRDNICEAKIWSQQGSRMLTCPHAIIFLSRSQGGQLPQDKIHKRCKKVFRFVDSRGIRSCSSSHDSYRDGTKAVDLLQ